MNENEKNLPTIDLDHIESLDELKSEGQSDLVVELIHYFNKVASTKMKSIKEAISKKDFETAMKDAHNFKSTCHNVGAKKLASMCQEIETEARECMKSHKSTNFDALKSIELEYNEAATVLADILKARSL